MPEDRVTGRSPAEKVRNYYEGIRWVHERFRVFDYLPQPIVCAVQGYCLGFGFELALMCDIRVAADDALFVLPEAQVGVSIDAGGDLRLADEIGAGHAKLLALTGRRITAAEAERLGIVQQLTTREDLGAHGSRALPPTSPPMPRSPCSRSSAPSMPLPTGVSRRRCVSKRWSVSVEFVSDDMPAGYAAKAKKQQAEFQGK